MERTSFNPSSEGISNPAPALERGLSILELFSVGPESMTLADVCAELNMPRNSILRLLQTLVSCGYLIREDSPPRYRLSGKLLRISQPQVGEFSLVDCSLEAMRELRDRVGETVQLGVPTGDEGIIIEKVESKAAIRIGVEIGLRFPLYNNAPGKVLLACSDPADRDARIASLELKRHTPRTITSRAELKKECNRILEQGYGVDWGEADEEIHCVAAPIRDGQGNLLATIWVSGLAGRMPEESFADVGAEAIAAASSIEKKIQR